MQENESLDQAIDRLQHAIRNEPQRRIIFLLGSGVSLPSIPDTQEMVSYMCRELGPAGNDLRARLSGLDPTEAYQQAAKQLKLRRGDIGLATAIRRAVRSAHEEPIATAALAENPSDNGWRIPPAQSSLAALVSLIPAQQRGPIFTTNFDPLTEVALRTESIPVATIAVPASSAFPIQGIFGAIPVVHLHGYWLDSATLSTAAQLEFPRPGVEEMLHAQLSNALIVVSGYGGWNDSFTRSLLRVAEDGRLAALQAEILWMAYSDESQALKGRLVSALSGAPGFNLYGRIDAHSLFRGVAQRLRQFFRESRDSYVGWSAVPASSEIDIAEKASLTRFTEGAQPTWSDAKSLPQLAATSAAVGAAEGERSAVGDAVVVLIGPTGEGKSLALRQIALQVAKESEAEDVSFLFREPGAPTLSMAWIRHLKSKNPLTYIFVDEADLLLTDILGALRDISDTSGRIVWVMAIHSHYQDRINALGSSVSTRLHQIHFNELAQEDSEAIAEAWLKAKILPDAFSQAPVSRIAELIRESGSSPHGNSLFGAVLNLWMGNGLQDRVLELLRKLDRISIRGITYKEILEAIALVQCAWDPEEVTGEGISLAAVGMLCDLRSEDVVSLIIAPLGREVGIAQIGDRVYVRHPSIAESILEAITESGEIGRIARRLGVVGGRMRVDQQFSSPQFRSAYLLWQKLTGNASTLAAQGAVEGAPTRLESRISYLANLRRQKLFELASRMAENMERDLQTYSDRRYAERGYWVERAAIARGAGDMDRSVGFALKSLTDLSGSDISLDQLRYGLVNTIVASKEIRRRRVATGEYVFNAALDLLALVPGADEVYKDIRRHPRPDGKVLNLVHQFRLASLPFSKGLARAGEWKFQRLAAVIGRIAEQGE